MSLSLAELLQKQRLPPLLHYGNVSLSTKIKASRTRIRNKSVSERGDGNIGKSTSSTTLYDRLSVPRFRVIRTDRGNHQLVKNSEGGDELISLEGHTDCLTAPAPGCSEFWIIRSYDIQNSSLPRSILKLVRPSLISGSTSSREDSSSSISTSCLEKALEGSKVLSEVYALVDKMAKTARTMTRCGFLFDLISRTCFIDSGLVHVVGKKIYEYIQTEKAHLTQVKFVFVGITDNSNCRASRDVFCRDPTTVVGYAKKRAKELQGRTRPSSLTRSLSFEALDNSHMYIVFP